MCLEGARTGRQGKHCRIRLLRDNYARAAVGVVVMATRKLTSGTAVAVVRLRDVMIIGMIRLD